MTGHDLASRARGDDGVADRCVRRDGRRLEPRQRHRLVGGRRRVGYISFPDRADRPGRQPLQPRPWLAAGHRHRRPLWRFPSHIGAAAARRALRRAHPVARPLWRVGHLSVRHAALPELRRHRARARHRAADGRRALRRVRKNVPDLAAARPARRDVRPLARVKMENLEALLHGFTIAVTLPHIVLMIGGVLLGILVGVLPGLGAPNGVSLLLPLTFGMAPVSAIILLSSIYWGALFGGSVTSILFNIPGEPSSVATTFDGYPMARDGRPTAALATAFGSAAFGALVGVVLITLLASWVAKAALAFGPPEYFAVYFLAFASFVGMGGSPPIKTLVSLAIGFALAAVGIDTVSGSVRLTMGIDELVKGVNFVVAVMGLF